VADADCEAVNLDTVPPAPPADQPAATPELPPILPPAPTGGLGNAIEAPVATIAAAPLAVSTGGVAAVRLQCPSEVFEGCAGTILIEALGVTGRSKLDVSSARRSRTKIGAGRFKVAAGEGATIPVRLDRRNWRKLSKRRRVRVRITVTMENAAGTTTNTRVVTVRPAR
jgi:hypothetical protein